MYEQPHLDRPEKTEQEKVKDLLWASREEYEKENKKRERHLNVRSDVVGAKLWGQDVATATRKPFQHREEDKETEKKELQWFTLTPEQACRVVGVATMDDLDKYVREDSLLLLATGAKLYKKNDEQGSAAYAISGYASDQSDVKRIRQWLEEGLSDLRASSKTFRSSV